MSSNWLSCKGCIGSDPTQDTVKIDPNLMFRENPQDKENTRPTPHTDKQGADLQREREAKEQKLAEERRKQAEEVAKRLQREQEAAAANEEFFERRRQKEQKEAAEKATAEQARQEAEEQRRAEVAAREAATAAAAAAEKQRLRQEQEAAMRAAEEQRVWHERAAAEVAEIAAAQEVVDNWCKSNGFKNSSTQKKTLRGATKFPLHTAVKQQNVEMVQMLLKCGAKKDARDSKKQTPGDLAVKMNTTSGPQLDQIITLLN